MIDGLDRKFLSSQTLEMVSECVKREPADAMFRGRPIHYKADNTQKGFCHLLLELAVRGSRSTASKPTKHLALSVLGHSRIGLGFRSGIPRSTYTLLLGSMFSPFNSSASPWTAIHGQVDAGELWSRDLGKANQSPMR